MCSQSRYELEENKQRNGVLNIGIKLKYSELKSAKISHRALFDIKPFKKGPVPQMAELENSSC